MFFIPPITKKPNTPYYAPFPTDQLLFQKFFGIFTFLRNNYLFPLKSDILYKQSICSYIIRYDHIWSYMNNNIWTKSIYDHIWSYMIFFFPDIYMTNIICMYSIGLYIYTWYWIYILKIYIWVYIYLNHFCIYIECTFTYVLVHTYVGHTTYHEYYMYWVYSLTYLHKICMNVIV